MPKTAKKGFTYFRFETDHFYDPKVKRLKNKFGMEGWGVFHFIVNEIFRVEGCYMVMDADGLFDIADYSRMDECRIAAIIDYCTDLGLFDKRLWQEKQILTSKYIQELYTGICKAIHRRPAIPGELLLYSPENLQETVPASYPVPEERASTMEANVSVLSEKEKASRPESPYTHPLPASGVSHEVLREKPEILRENKPQNKNKENISSPNPSTIPSGNPDEENFLSRKLKSMGVSENNIRWVHFLRGYYPDFPVETAIREIEQSHFQLTTFNYLEPLINNYIAKYNAEYGQADRERKQAETMRSMRKTLDLLGIAARDQQEIMQLAAVAPVVLASVLKETWGNRRIKSPTRFILSRMRQAVPMSA